jgi:hypothetical protein|tara:strand:- start:7926 stop:11411 length:3486 start_codon:yes stop_codon:yes gene_type:complete
MSYRLNKTDGTLLVDLIDGEIDIDSSDIVLIGRNYKNYGEYLNENFLSMLENFSNSNAPENPLTGQLWFDTDSGRLQVYDGASFKAAGGPTVQNSFPNNPVAGDLFINNEDDQLFFYDGNNWALAGPIYTTSQGKTGFETDNILDELGRNRVILKQYIQGTLIGIWSGVQFTPASGFEIAGIDSPVLTGFTPVNDAFQYNGTSLNARNLIDELGNVRNASAFLPADSNGTTIGTLTIQNSGGLTVGTSQNNVMKVVGESFVTENGLLDHDYKIRVRSSLFGAIIVDAVTIDASAGNVGIFQGTPAFALDVTGDGHFTTDLTVDGTTNATIESASLLAQVVAVSGAGSAIDADLLDGLQGVDYVAVSDIGVTVLATGSSPLARNVALNQDPVSAGTVTLGGMSSTIYVGNASASNITTGVDMATDDRGGSVWIKSRTDIRPHQQYDTVRGAFNVLRPNTPDGEVVEAVSLDAFTSTGFSILTGFNDNINAVGGENYVAWSFQTTQKATGTTNSGSAYTAHYNSGTGYAIVGYAGDGTEIHDVPTFLNKPPQLSMFKAKTAGVFNWHVKSPLLEDFGYFNLNTDEALQTDSGSFVVFQDNSVRLSSFSEMNAAATDYISYHYTSVDGVCKVDTYRGTGQSGNIVRCGFKAAWIMIKNLATGAFDIYDLTRGMSTGTAPVLKTSSTGAEIPTYYVASAAEGFVLTSSDSAGNNSLGDEHIFVAYAEGIPNDNIRTVTTYQSPTPDDVLTINNGTLISFAEGFDSVKQVDSQELVGTGTTLSLGAGFENQTLYVYKDKAGSFNVTENRNIEGTSRDLADKFGVASPSDTGKRTTAAHTDYVSLTGTVSSSEDALNGATNAWWAFAQDDPTLGFYWEANTTALSSLQYKAVEKRVLKSWRMLEVTDGSGPRRFTITASNDGITWTVIDATYQTFNYPSAIQTDGSTVTNNIWGGLQDLSANTTAYLYHRIDITANQSGTGTTIIGELELNTVIASDYYNVTNGITYNDAGTPISRTYLAKVETGANGEISKLENLPVAKIRGVDAELHGDVTIRGNLIVNGTLNSSEAVTFRDIISLDFDLSTADNFKATITGTPELTFTNIAVGSAGSVYIDNSAGATATAAATTYITATDLAAINATGIHLLSYFSDGTNVLCSVKGTLTSAGV